MRTSRAVCELAARLLNGVKWRSRQFRDRLAYWVEAIFLWVEATYLKLTRRTQFVTERRRPRIVRTRGPASTADLRSDTAIVVQGPVRWFDELSRQVSTEFTLETLRQYRLNFPNAPIILSTWDDDCSADVHSWCRQWGIDLLAQKPPQNSGISNTNLQMASSALGVLHAKSLGASFTLKTRTDQRIGNNRFLDLLHAALRVFPPVEGTVLQDQRIVALSFNTFLYRLYGVTDMFTFGTTRDVATYWSGRHDPRPPTWAASARTPREYATMRVCEVDFCANFLESTGWDLQWSLTDYWDALRKRFIVLDASSVDFLWPKYSRLEERWSMYRGYYYEEVSFASWLSILVDQHVEANESLLDLPVKRFMPQ